MTSCKNEASTISAHRSGIEGGQAVTLQNGDWNS